MSDAAAFESAITEFDNGVEKLRGVWDDLVRGVNWVLGKLPGILAGKLRDMFAELAAKFTEAIDNMVKYATERGSAAAIIAAGDGWNTEVGNKASDQAGLLAKEALDTDNEWTGGAADRYTEAIAAQGRALNQFKTLTDNVQSTLNEIASALKNYWVAMAVAIAGYIIAMVAASIAMAAVATAPAGVVAAIAATITVIGTTATFSVAYGNTLAEKKAKLEQQTTMDGSFAAGSWPSAVTEKMTEWTPK
jgi:uncharacterized protein YukE